MKPNPDDIEFERLAQRWLDHSASENEARSLWQTVAADPTRAHQLATLVRFETLLTTTLQTRLRSEDAVKQTSPSNRVRPQIPQKASHASTRKPEFLALVAALVLLVGLGWMLGSGGSPTERLTRPADNQAKIPRQGPTPAVSTETPYHSPPAPAVLSSSSHETFAATLDALYLTHVELDGVPLGRALNILQGQMRKLDRTFLTSGLRITVPTDASMRKISLTSGPISFLKAVQTVAAIAGCAVQVDAEKVALILQKELYPEPSILHDMLDVLAGRLTPQGRPATEDEASLAGLLADAASLGITVDTSQPEWHRTRMTRGQLTALRHLTEARAALGLIPAPAFQLYIATAPSGADTEPATRSLTQPEAEAWITSGSFTGPLSPIITPLTASTPGETISPLVSFRPNGAENELILTASSTANASSTDAPAKPISTTQPVLLRTSGAVFVGEDGALYQTADTEPQMLLLVPTSNHPQPSQP